MNMKLHISHLRAQDVSTRAFAAHWGEGGYICNHLINEARDNLVSLLSAASAGVNKDDCRSVLIDLIATSITDSTDIDCTPESQAEAILDALLNNCLPMPVAAE